MHLTGLALLFSLQMFFRHFSASAPPQDQEKRPWFLCCVQGRSGLSAPAAPSDLDPMTCCVQGREEGISGLLLLRVCLCASPLRDQAGETFVLQLSAELLGRLDQPAGVVGAGELDLSHLAVQGNASKGQSSHPVTEFDDGSFETEDIQSEKTSSADGWTQKTEVVRPAVSHLKMSVSGLQLTSEDLESECKELLTDMKHLLVLNLTVSPDDFSSDQETNKNNSECFSGRVIHLENCTIRCQNYTFFISICKDSFCTRTLVQGLVGKLFLKASGVMAVRRNHSVSFNITAGTNVSLCVNAKQRNTDGSDKTGSKISQVLFFNHTGAVVVEFQTENRVSSQNKSVSVYVEGNRKSSPQVRVNPTWRPPTAESPAHSPAHNAVQIYSAKQAYPTNTDITLLAVAQVPDPVEFLWHFGDSKSARTTSRSITKRYQRPGRYDVVVTMFSSGSSVTSPVFPLVVQKAVKLNRLLHPASVLRNQTVTLRCRVTAGTDVNFLWSFGDGTSRAGQSTEQHTFSRIGEFTPRVTVSNLVSSTFLSSHIFVVERPCQPPPVKNMGPLKLQVRRYEVIRLGVTYEAEVDCDISGGLQYTWSLFDSAGRVFPLSSVNTQRQSLTVPNHLLLYDTYKAVARVQITGSVVYSNYSVRVQVIPSPPVAFIKGGTNIFINRNTGVVSLDGRRSYDPDFPMNPVSYSWTCTPVSAITTSCFQQDVQTSSPVLVFPASSLKQNFDQFKLTLRVQSGDRSASTEIFLTVTPKMTRKLLVDCPLCRGEVSWDQTLSVQAMCEGCDTSSKHLQYSWSLYRVNASSKMVLEVPFCYTVDLGAPSTVMEAPAAPHQTPGTSTLHPPLTDASPYTAAVSVSESRVKVPDLNRTHGDALTGLTNTGPTSAGSGEEPFYHPQGEFDPPESFYSSTEYQTPALDNSRVLYSDHSGQTDVISEFSIDPDSSADWDFSFPVPEGADLEDELDSQYDVPLMSPEEGDPGISAGRPTGVDGETFSLGDDSVFDHEDQGSNLVGHRPPVAFRDPVLLDLTRDPVDGDIFKSYTFTGISSPLLNIRPFSLRPESRYMLEVTAKSRDSFLGRTQLYLKTDPAPRGMTCQVQPTSGMELYTHFSIFCTSGKEDLEYEYNMSVGHKPPRTLYQGRDFQYYFSLPAGDPHNDYKVNLSTVIRSSTHGTATKPCAVTVRVLPSFLRGRSSPSHLDPDLELSEAGLKNLSALVRIGNSVEVRNYVSLVSSVLNRLSRDAEANTQAQKQTRDLLIRTLCELESSDQASMLDNISILKNLLQVTHQVTLAGAKRVTDHLQTLSERFLQSNAPGLYHLDQKTLSTLVTLLSYILQAGLCRGDSKLASESHSHDENVRNISSNSCLPDPSNGVQMEKLGSLSRKRKKQLVADILQTASDLMLKYIMFHNVPEHQVSTDFITLYSKHQTSPVSTGGCSTFYLPSSLMQRLPPLSSRDRERPCVLSVLTELNHSPYIWAQHPGRLHGPVVDLTLHTCSTRRKIPVHSFNQPITIKLQPQQKKSSECQYVLLRNNINYHSFNITQEHLQQAIQLSVVFMPTLNKAFPIMLLFRMFERPTPSMHHLHRMYHWEGNTTRFTLPQSYLSAAGVGHLTLLNADFGKAAQQKHLSEEVSYSLTVDSSLCLSWDDHRGAWTQRGCSTQQADTSTGVNCSCHQLKPLTVVQQQIQSSHDSVSLDPFLGVSYNLSVLGLLLFCVCLYIPALVVCRRADVVSEGNQRAHYLSDNSPTDSYLYVVTIHTGPCSAAQMSAKVYIELHGEDGASQTKELHVPGCTLFRRNSQDTFIISTAESLGPVLGVHIWHDNSGRSPSWYLKHMEVSEVNRGHVKGRAWLFLGQCWLAVSEDDGRVERMLHVCSQGVGFAKMFFSNLSDFLADYHTWMSVHSCPCLSSFTRTQRLAVSLLLLLGYACVNAVLITRMEDQVLVEVGIIDVSSVSVTTGVLSVMAVMPAAAVVSFLFRRREVQMVETEEHEKCRNTGRDFLEDAPSATDGLSEPQLFWSGLHPWTQDTWRSKDQDTDLESVSATVMENKNTIKEPGVQTDAAVKHHASVFEKNTGSLFVGGHAVYREKDPEGEKEDGSRQQLMWSRFRPLSQWCRCVAWTLCLLMTLCCLLLSAVLGMRFSSSQLLLWIHSLFFSLMSCIFFIQPAVIITVAAVVSFWFKDRADFHSFCTIEKVSKQWSFDSPSHRKKKNVKTTFPQERRTNLESLLVARQRARFLRHVNPPTRAELRKSCVKKRREALICKTVRDLSLSGSMLFLMLCINHGSSFRDHNNLNKAVRGQLLSVRENAFMSIRTHADWWTWAQTDLLDLLYKNKTAATQSYILIGEPVLLKTEKSSSFQSKVSTTTPVPEHLKRTSNHTHPRVLFPDRNTLRMCGLLGCYSGPTAAVDLGHMRSDAESNLKLLRSGRWLNRDTAAVKVQFTLFSPATNLFTGVTMLAEQSLMGVLLPSETVQSVRVYQSPAVWDYVVMVCQLLFLVLSMIHLWDQVSSVGKQGLMVYCRTPCTWLEVSLLVVALVYYVYYIHHSVITVDVLELLQRNSHRRVDVQPLADWEQCLRTLRGLLLFLLTIKCLTVLTVIKMFLSAALLTRSLSRLLWPMVSVLILMRVLTCVGAFRGILLSGHDLLYCGVFHLISTVWAAVVIIVMSSLVRGAKASKSRNNGLTVAELSSYVRQRLSEFTGFTRKYARTENQEERRMYHLEEFESLVDELMFKLNVLSDSLHHTLPPKAHGYRDEDSPVASPTQEHSQMDAQNFVRPLITEKPTANDRTDVSGHQETFPPSHLLGSNLDMEQPQQKCQSQDNSSSDVVVEPDYLQHETRAEENTRNAELSVYVRTQNCLTIPESTSLLDVSTENVLEMQQRWLSEAQATHTEVLVEVLVHVEPESVALDTL